MFIALGFAVAGLAFIALALWWRARIKASIEQGFSSTHVMTDDELAMFHRIKLADPAFLVLPQVPLARVLTVRDDRNQEGLRLIDDQTVDFVVCDEASRVLAVIELDRDAKLGGAAKLKETMLLAAGLRVLRWRIGELPSSDAIRLQVAGQIWQGAR
ncbi:MAG TPA: DUF2726 domain-containing protein [Rhodocyclaceae bacterium]|nr:DUF2726 domain-containing protein [Rhodocyclaceae bacterium]